MALATLYAIAAAAAIGACGGGPRRPAAAATMALVERAESRERERRYDQARALYERASAEAPDPRSRAWAARQFADSLMFWGEYEAAERQLEQVVATDPANAGAWHDLGLLRHRRGDLAGAERALRTSASRAPADPRPRVALAALLVNSRRFDEALGAYRALLALELPERTRAAVQRAIAIIEAEMGAGAQR